MDSLSREVARFAASRPRAWVWVLPLAGLPAHATESLIAALSEDERIRTSAFLFKRDALAYAAAHMLLRWSLGVRYQRLAGDWRFTVGALGKPSLSQPPAGDPRISVSHTDGLVAVALAEGFEVGVDAEALKPNGDLHGIASDCFSAAEREQLTRPDCGFGSDAERFYAFWTLKEALLKARGLGLNQAPNSFSVDLRSMKVTVPAELSPAHEWHLEWRRPTPQHLVSVALDAPRVEHEVTFSVIEDAGAWVRALTRQQ